MFEFIETPLFTRLLDRYLSDDEYAGLQKYLDVNPEAGIVVPGSGGVRKVRWGLAHQGKSGGVRVIYYLRMTRKQMWMLTLYGKNEVANIPSHVLKEIRKSIEDAQDCQ